MGDAQKLVELEDRINKRLYYLENEWGKTTAQVSDLEAELSNARAQGLENEKELVTLRLELQVLSKKFEEHRHQQNTDKANTVSMVSTPR